ncbi:MAG: P-loop NTPase fold protein [Wolbachia endosymbiont of Tyrophagus putrescentiae]|nr:P-loop NTPase fold protein [Wolbachia endosymbiont of Tyrophagus putrescentiae]
MCFKKLIALIKPKEKNVPQEKPWQDDLLGYERFSGKFNHVIKAMGSSFSIVSMEGYNGWGKTFFLKEWVKNLKQENEIATYYSAWDINALDQPLASFLNFLFEDLFVSHKVRKSITKQFANINQELLSFKTLEKVMSKSPLGMFSVLLDATKEADRKDIGSILREVKDLKRRKEGIQDFKKQLTKVVNKIRGEKNIYIMVDDLEVCRPKFIVDFLESIRCMLNIEGLIFVISVDKEQSSVKKAIDAVLGSNFSLKHFTDLSLSLPKQAVAKFVKELFKNVRLPRKSKGVIVDSFIFYAETLSLSLKTIEHCIKKIKLTYSEDELPCPNLFSFLIILQSINNDLYECLENKEAFERIADTYKSTMLIHINGEKEWERLKASLEAALAEKNFKAIRQIKGILL